jgi:hypothetical protein
MIVTLQVNRGHLNVSVCRHTHPDSGNGVQRRRCDREPVHTLETPIHAGADGIRRKLTLAPPPSLEIRETTDRERASAGFHRLPELLEDALTQLESSGPPGSGSSTSSFVSTCSASVRSCALVLISRKTRSPRAMRTSIDWEWPLCPFLEG